MSKRKRAEKLIGQTVVLYERAYVVDGVDVQWDNMCDGWTEAEQKTFVETMIECGRKPVLCLRLVYTSSEVEPFKVWRKVNSRCRYETL